MAGGSLARSSASMAVGSLASRVLGMVRNGVLTAIIGLGAASNSFNFANTLPNVIYMLVAGGVLNAVLVPQLTKAMKSEDGGQEFANRVITVAIIIMLAITAIVIASSGLLVTVFGGRMHPDGKALAFAFLLVTLPQIFFYGLYALLGQVLNARNQFAAFAWAPVVANLVAIVGLVTFSMKYPKPPGGHVLEPGEWTSGMIVWFAGTATLSVVAQALFLIPALHRTGFRYRPIFGFRGVGLGGAGRMAIWAFAGLGLSQLGYFVTVRALNDASSYSMPGHFVGGLAVQATAFLVFIIPHGMITVSLLTALYPRMANAAHAGRIRPLRATYVQGLMMPLTAILPLTVFFILLAGPIVGFLNPGVDPVQADVTRLTLIWMMVGLLGFGIDLLNYRFFFALEAPRVPFVMQIIVTSFAVLAGLLTYRSDPTRAVVLVALGQTAGNSASALYGVAKAHDRLVGLPFRYIFRTFGKLLLACIPAGLAAVGLLHLAEPVFTWVHAAGQPGSSISPGLARLLGYGGVLGVTSLVFGTLYAVTAARMGVHEVIDILDLVMRRFGGGGNHSGKHRPRQRTS